MHPKPRLAAFGLNEFPPDLKPPITSNSVVHFDRATIQNDALNTRIVVHPRFPRLVQQFLFHKQRHGSGVEKAFYGVGGWRWETEVSRLVEKRALVFLGGSDVTVLRTGKQIGRASAEWDRVGTDAEKHNKYLFLRDYLSYDEIMLSSLIGVSGPSFFVNEGERNNAGRLGQPGMFEPRGIIIGLVGARFEREDRMDAMFALSRVENPILHPKLKDIFLDFFQQPPNPGLDFDESMYRARIGITADILFLEANKRAKAVDKMAHVYVVGLGLGVWAYKGGRDQSLPYVQAFIESLGRLASGLTNIGAVEFAWIGEVLDFEQRMMTFGTVRRDIDIRFSRCNPAGRLSGPDANRLLVLSYAWDGNSYPGNEYWMGSLTATGDPAAACMSTIGELHNPMINPGFLDRIEVLGDRRHAA
ncbi:hypothetical protein F4777DRAFT_578478 [Nemania sp. FL0916]|nr:hypothetical protein F4777DRAFT_578478 [Nemania sp. FL0916]